MGNVWLTILESIAFALTMQLQQKQCTYKNISYSFFTNYSGNCSQSTQCHVRYKQMKGLFAHNVCVMSSQRRGFIYFSTWDGGNGHEKCIWFWFCLFSVAPRVMLVSCFYQFLISFSMVGTTLFQHCKLRFSFAEKCGWMCVLCKFQLIFFLCVFNPIE